MIFGPRCVCTKVHIGMDMRTYSLGTNTYRSTFTDCFSSPVLDVELYVRAKFLAAIVVAAAATNFVLTLLALQPFNYTSSTRGMCNGKTLHPSCSNVTGFHVA